MKKVKKIDIHVHSILSKVGSPDDNRGGNFTTPDELRRIYDRYGIEFGVQLPLSSPEGRGRLITSEESYLLAQRFPETYVWFCNVDPRQGYNTANFDLTVFLKAYKEMGAKGVGEVCANLYIDDPYMYNLFGACEKMGMPLTFHIGTKGISYGMVDDLGLPRLEKALQDFPNLIFLGHSQLFWAEISGDCTEDIRGGYPTGKVVPGGRVVELMRKYPNLYGDMSAGSGTNAFMRDPEHAYKMFEEFQDRLFFGTDICDPAQEEDEMLLMAKFLDDAMEQGKISYDAYYKISRGNALKLLGMTEKE
ncbi:MAG: hypothetical protein E7665_07125 [Ruminococcaceae bacterium]|nr:hypothetical protein [Oscillospiraceae bacterium]